MTGLRTSRLSPGRRIALKNLVATSSGPERSNRARWTCRYESQLRLAASLLVSSRHVAVSGRTVRSSQSLAHSERPSQRFGLVQGCLGLRTMLPIWTAIGRGETALLCFATGYFVYTMCQAGEQPSVRHVLGGLAPARHAGLVRELLVAAKACGCSVLHQLDVPSTNEYEREREKGTHRARSTCACPAGRPCEARRARSGGRRPPRPCARRPR